MNVVEDRVIGEEFAVPFGTYFLFNFLCTGDDKDNHENECPICLDTFKNPKTLKKCKHKFCTSCIDQALKVNNRCPVCKAPCGVLRGSQSPVAVAFSSLSYVSRPCPSSSAPFQELGKDSRENECPICLDNFKNPQTLNKCQHKFCKSCIDQALKINNRCPVCKAPCGALRGNQPAGTMNWRFDRYNYLPGYKGYGTIIINYHFPSGTQTAEHPNPGQRYSGADRVAYLPDSPEGREVLQLLRKAFDARLVFTVGTSVTSGLSNQTTWNDVHHKTSTHGGPIEYELSEIVCLISVISVFLLLSVCLSVCLSRQSDSFWLTLEIFNRTFR